MNACGHHHVGHIGILGVDKNGEEWYQVSIGGAQGNDAALGKVIGPSFAADEMPDVVERLIETYLEQPRRGRALHRHRAPHRHRTLQGTRLCHSSLRNRALADDRCTLLRDAATLADVPDGVPVIVPLALWLERRERADRARRHRRLARAGRRSGALADDLDALPVIAIDFPQFTDGRGYSHRAPAARALSATPASCARSATSCAISCSTSCTAASTPS